MEALSLTFIWLKFEPGFAKPVVSCWLLPYISNTPFSKIVLSKLFPFVSSRRCGHQNSLALRSSADRFHVVFVFFCGRKS
jgi:hypothetical protein